jgi:hypothetical protein
MKRPAIFVLFVAALSVSAQPPENQKTVGLRNGRYWAAQTEGSKIDFVVGFSEALAATGFHAQSDWSEHFRGTETIGEAVRGLNQFYEDPANAAIPIEKALVVFARKLKGEPPEDSAALIAKLRGIFNAAAEGTPTEKEK